MNIALEHIGHGFVDQPVPRDRGQAAKRLGDDADTEVALTAGGARMPGMVVAVIFNEEGYRREADHERRAQALFPRGMGHGLPSAGDGLVLPLNQMTCGIMNTSMAAVMPNTLKLTQMRSSKFCAM